MERPGSRSSAGGGRGGVRRRLLGQRRDSPQERGRHGKQGSLQRHTHRFHPSKTPTRRREHARSVRDVGPAAFVLSTKNRANRLWAASRGANRLVGGAAKRAG